MPLKISYIAPDYGFDEKITHIGAPENAKKNLEMMGQAIAGSNQLVAIYIPLGTDDAYQVNNARGIVVGTVKLLPMPNTKTINDYFYKDFDGSLRWPIGWPCEAIHFPDFSTCKYLRSLVDKVHGPNSFQAYTSKFQQGPFELDRKVKIEIEKEFI